MTGHTTFRGLRAYTTVAIAVAIVAVGSSVWRDRHRAIAEGNREIRNVSAIFGGHMSRALQAFDIMLRDVQRQAETEINRTDVDGEVVLGTQSFHRTLSNYAVSLPQVLHIIVTDRRGDTLAASSVWPVPRLNFADRSYFIELTVANDDHLVITEPVQNRITGETAINFVRRLRGTDGSFRGVALVSFTSAYLEGIFGSVDVRSSQVFALVRRDGTVLVSYPEGFAKPGETVDTLPQFLAAVTEGGGSYQTRDTVGGPMRWIAMHLLPDYPLVVLTGVPENVLLADWRVSVILTITQFLVLLVIAIRLLYIIAHQFRQLSASEASLKATSLTLDAALNNMSQGVAMFDANARLIVSNEHFRHMLRLPVQLTKPGMPLRDILSEMRRHSDLPAGVEDTLTEVTFLAASGEAQMHDLGAPGDRILAVRDVPMPDGGWVSTFEDVTEIRANEAHIRVLAHHDILTGVDNRARFLERLAEAQERLRSHSQPFAVLIIDLDQFKHVNDSLGHGAGDALLRETARRLKASIRESDVLARLGGDEFAVIIASPRLLIAQGSYHADLCESATVLAQRIIAAVGHPFGVDGRAVVVGASIGIALAPYDGSRADELMRKADLALYKAKSNGRNGYALFDRTLAADAEQRHRLEQDLRIGIARGDFELHYQPQVETKTCRPRGMEALVRWRHPHDGLIMPDRFIPLTEDTGLIVPLGEWILRTACVEATRWPVDVKVAVNVSPVQFHRSDLFKTVTQALSESGLPPQRLEIEITERVLFDTATDNLAVLRRLKTLGVSIALDDFGTGYSSLSYLAQFQFDKIKIDRSFTRDLLEYGQCAAITAAVVYIGRSLDLVTVAEGCETLAQFEALRTAGVDQIQGYLFGRPVRAQELLFDTEGTEQLALIAV